MRQRRRHFAAAGRRAGRLVDIAARLRRLRRCHAWRSAAVCRFSRHFSASRYVATRVDAAIAIARL